MRLQTLFFAAPLLVAAAAHGQTSVPPHNFQVPYDSRSAVPTFGKAPATTRTFTAPAGSAFAVSGVQLTLPTTRIKLDPAQVAMLSSKQTCYAIRSYDYSPDADASGLVRSQGSSTCQPSSNSHVRSAISR